MGNVNRPMFLITTFISAVFSRLLSALLVAAPQSRATKGFVSLHCSPAPPPASAKIRLRAFRSEPDCSPPSKRREQSRSFKNERQKYEHN